MIRKITCPDCGKMKPTPADDAALGLYERRTYGKLRGSALCDYCGKELDRGDNVIALTIPTDAPDWEDTYLTRVAIEPEGLVDKLVDAVYRSMSEYEDGTWFLDNLKAKARVKVILKSSAASHNPNETPASSVQHESKSESNSAAFDALVEASKKALTCASLNSDVRALIVAALALAEKEKK